MLKDTKQSEKEIYFKIKSEGAQTGAYGESLGSLVHQPGRQRDRGDHNQTNQAERDRGDHNQIAQTLRRPTCINFSYSWNLTFSHLAFIFS